MRPVLFVVLDGWGINPRRDGNAILLQGTPNLDKLAGEFPFSQLLTSGLAVGLPEGQMGNSEVGHTNLGAGRVVYQDLVRINRAISSGELFHNPVLRAAMAQARGGKALHLLGLVSDGGVHSQQDHLDALVEMARREGVQRVFVHAFTDGRDCSPSSGAGFLEKLEATLARASRPFGMQAQVATVSGRYFAMDRDFRWDRVRRAYDALVRGEGLKAASGVQALRDSYARGEGDEFLQPTVIAAADGTPRGRLRDGDSAIFFNFRADRGRELTQLLAFDDPPAWDGKSGTVSEVRGPRPQLQSFATLTEYDARFSARGLPCAFPPEQPTEILPELIARAGVRQLRCAETEKYAHVTFFFNGGREQAFAGEDRILVPSPREVKTYDLKPEMSAEEVTRRLEAAIADYGFVLVNYANADMVGHTGVMPAALKAVAKIDECLGRVWAAAQRAGMAMVVTADHGNIEQMVDYQTGEPFTQHTTNPVPIYICDPALKGARLRTDGILADVAPTLLAMMGFPQPAAMTGKSLLAP